MRSAAALASARDDVAQVRYSRSGILATSRRENQDSPLVVQARESLAAMRVPVWGGQITTRANFVLALSEGEGVKEYDADSMAAAEIARLWSAIEKSVKAIRGLADAAGAMHRRAA